MGRPVKAADLELYRMFSDPSLSPDGTRVAYSIKKADLKEDNYESDIFVSDTASGKMTKFTSGKKDQDPRWSPDGRSILFVSKRGFAKGEKGTALYTISSSGGEASLVLKRESGVESPQWSPDSKRILFLSDVAKKEKDDVKVIRRLPFWFNGVGFVYNKRKHLFSVDLETKKVKQLTKGPFDLSDFSISHSGSKIAYLASVAERKPYVSDLFVLGSSGKAKKLTGTDMEISSLCWSPDDRQIVVIGDELPRGFASNSLVFIFEVASGRRSLPEQADRSKANGLNSDVRAKSHGPTNVAWTKEGIWHLQAEGGNVVLRRFRPGGPGETVVGGDTSVEGFEVADGRVAYVAMEASRPEELFVKSRTTKKLTSENEAALSKLDVAVPRKFNFKASDGEEIEGWVLVPKGGRRPYPLVLYVHGGPKTAFGQGFMHEFQVFAGAGFGVVYLNPRGSDGYSEEFADIRGKYGTRDFLDLMEGLDYALKKNPDLDGKRVAIAGGSYGGFMTNWAVGHTDRFKAAVTDRSIATWGSFWGTSDIGPHFTRDQVGGDPWNANGKHVEDSPLTYVDKVTTPVMIVHSMEDYRCWMVEGIQFFTALKELGKEVELVLFPGENHDLSRVGKPKHRVARLNHYVRWFKSHL